MLIAEIIQHAELALPAELLASEALSRLRRSKWDALPVVDTNSGIWLGNISTNVLSRAEPESLLRDLVVSSGQVVHYNQHLFDAMRILLKYEMQVLPVVGDASHYEGWITREQTTLLLGRLCNVEELGSIIMVEMQEKDYTLSKLIRLIEEYDAKILSVSVQTPNLLDSKLFRVSVKVNVQEASRIKAGLKRHGFVVTTPNRDELLEMEFEHRADELIHFLEI